MASVGLILKKLTYYYIFVWFLISWLNVFVDFYFTENFHNITVGGYFYHFLVYRFPYQLPFVTLCMIKVKSKWLQKTFAWKLWSFPSIGIPIIVLFQSPDIFRISIFGLHWTWIALSEWSFLFILQHCLYSRRGVEPFIAFALSYLGIFLGSTIYEVPWLVRCTPTPNIFPFLQDGLAGFVSLGLFIFLLHHEKTKLSWHVILTFIPIVLFWILYWQIAESASWLIRLGVYPLFLYLPFKIKPLRETGRLGCGQDVPAHEKP